MAPLVQEEGLSSIRDHPASKNGYQWDRHLQCEADGTIRKKTIDLDLYQVISPGHLSSKPIASGRLDLSKNESEYVLILSGRSCMPLIRVGIDNTAMTTTSSGPNHEFSAPAVAVRQPSAPSSPVSANTKKLRQNVAALDRIEGLAKLQAASAPNIKQLLGGSAHSPQRAAAVWVDPRLSFSSVLIELLVFQQVGLVRPCWNSWHCYRFQHCQTLRESPSSLTELARVQACASLSLLEELLNELLGANSSGDSSVSASVSPRSHGSAPNRAVAR
eukprot:NODE_1893_length_1365_cov_40.845745_g1714_i0.p1 GENE.NODE_1893_length_1365_cov_40.845745_g1714_i0~~NODE_1893_length_1365_cov_40.845745_g1714_i0.p1  ORF type:complete len:274 (-),score=22.15 NODE_1893_length_1365_cov_40.845745_g1714_i0:283-1104(-)